MASGVWLCGSGMWQVGQLQIQVMPKPSRWWRERLVQLPLQRLAGARQQGGREASRQLARHFIPLILFIVATAAGVVLLRGEKPQWRRQRQRSSSCSSCNQANGQRNVTWLQWKTGNWFSVTNCMRGRDFPVEFECVYMCVSVCAHTYVCSASVCALGLSTYLATTSLSLCLCTLSLHPSFSLSRIAGSVERCQGQHSRWRPFNAMQQNSCKNYIAKKKSYNLWMYYKRNWNISEAIMLQICKINKRNMMF